MSIEKHPGFGAGHIITSVELFVSSEIISPQCPHDGASPEFLITSQNLFYLMEFVGQSLQSWAWKCKYLSVYTIYRELHRFKLCRFCALATFWLSALRELVLYTLIQSQVLMFSSVADSEKWGLPCQVCCLWWLIQSSQALGWAKAPLCLCSEGAALK